MEDKNFKNNTLGFGTKLKAIREGQHMTVRQVSMQSGVSPSYWSQVENQKREIPTAKTLDKMANGLRVSSQRIYDIAGVSTSNDQSTFDIGKAIDNDQYMTNHGKQLTDKEKTMLKALFGE